MPDHALILLHTGSDWTIYECPVCGRVVFLKEPPNFKRVVLVPGNDTVTHSYAAPGLALTAKPEADEAKSIIQQVREWSIEGGIE